MTSWTEPVVLPSRAASELGARLSQLGVEPRMRYAGPGRMAVSVSTRDLPVFQEAMATVSPAGGHSSSYASDPVLAARREHLDAWQRASRGIQEGDCSRVSPSWADVLDEAQELAVHAMMEPGLLGFCLFDEQGTGKTFMALGLMHHLAEAEKITQVIVFCPASMLGEWAKKVQTLPCLTPRLRGRGLILNAGEHLLSIPKGIKVLITNYRQAVSRQVQLESWATKLMANGNPEQTMVIFDESFIVKNEESLASQSCMAIRQKAQYALILCGTPAPNRPKDIVHQVNLSDLGAALGAFRETENQDEDLQRLAHLVEDRAAFLRRLKKDVLKSLPDKLFSVKRLAMSPRHKALYEGQRSAYRSQLLSLGQAGVRRSYTDVLSGRARLIQLCSYPSADELPDAENRKYDALRELLVDICTNGGRKAVIWTSYLDSLDRTAKFVQFMGITVDVIHGEILPDERTAIVERFQHDNDPRVLICNPAAAGAGITLTAAADSIYMSYPSQAAHFLQSIDRIHRRGQSAREVKFHFLVFGSTIEDREFARLFRKEETQAELLGDVYQLPSTIEQFLSEIDG